LQLRIGNDHYHCSCVSYTTSESDVDNLPLIIGISVGVAVLLIIIIIILVVVVVVVCRRLRSSQAADSGRVVSRERQKDSQYIAINPATRDDSTPEYSTLDPAGVYDYPTLNQSTF